MYSISQYHIGLKSWYRITRSDTLEHAKRFVEKPFPQTQWVEREGYIEAVDSQGESLGFRIKEELTTS